MERKRKRSGAGLEDHPTRHATRKAGDATPAKHVHYPKGKAIRMGPTGTSPPARSPSPGPRSALRKPSDYGRDAGAQLQGELGESIPRLSPGRRGQSTTRQKSPSPGRKASSKGMKGLTGGLDGAQLKSPTPPARGGKRAAPAEDSDPDDDDDGDSDSESDIPVRKIAVPKGKGRATASSKAAPHSQGDDQICQDVDDLRSAVLELAKACPKAIWSGASIMKEMFAAKSEELIRYIGCLAMSGPKESWSEMLGEGEYRRALILGIIGRALKEHVFGELYFGAGEKLVKTLSKMEEEQAHQDGFFRTRERAVAIAKHKFTKEDESEHKDAVSVITAQLEKLLQPLWDIGTGSKKWTESDKEELAKIVLSAAKLSRSMRASGDVVYYWPPTFKDEEFEPERMECLNLAAMIENSPYEKKKTDGIERAQLRDRDKDDDRSEAIVRIVSFPGLVAYRQHGGSLAQRELREEQDEKKASEGKIPPDVQRQRRIISSREGELTGDEGFRTRVICKSIVCLKWGKQRLLTREAGTSRHIDAMKGDGKGMKKYKDDYKGFRELYELYQDSMKGQEPEKSPGFWGLFGSRSPSAPPDPAQSAPKGGRKGRR